MEYDMVVYESEEYRSKNPEDSERFDRSFDSLLKADIVIRRVMCSSADDIDPDGEARSIVSEKGMSALPIAEYQGVDISVGAYPSDQDLADFLDVPDGILSVDRQKPPAMGNDLPPACACRPVR
ncbi:hypothetical protein [Candidatus Methanoprimaticola sp. MG2]|uniref:hypothetical protein n=1 Tax=Candidatus Methanoprimaticola sp. MG2 TaxID=3228838 RepID=UPI0039C6ABE3